MAETVNPKNKHLEKIEKTLCVSCLVFFVLYFGLHCFRYPWIGDLGRYSATVASLYRDFLEPSHEAIDAPGWKSEMHTPYTVTVAAIGRLLAVTPYRALQLAGVANLILYAWSIWFFFRTFSIIRDSWIPSVAFLVVSLFLRDRIYLWSSDTSFASIRLIQAYPSLFAWGLALTMFAVADRYLQVGRKMYLVMIGLGIWVLILSHTLTASWVIGIVGLRSLWELVRCPIATAQSAEREERAQGTRRALTLAGALMLGIVLTYFWPYFDITQSFAMLPVAEGSKFADHPFRDMPRLYVLALAAGVLFVVLRKHSFLIACFLATWLMLQLSRYLGFEYLNRYAFFQAFFAQVAVAEVFGLAFLLAFEQTERLCKGLAVGRRLRDAVFLFAGATLALIATAPAIGLEAREGRPLLGLTKLITMPPSLYVYYGRLGPLTAHLHPGDLVLMPLENEAWDVASITGAKVVISPYAYRVPDYAQRVQDVAGFLSQNVAPETRDAIIRRYHITRILLTREYLDLTEDLSRQYGAPLANDSSFALFDTSSVASMGYSNELYSDRDRLVSSVTGSPSL